MDQQLVDSTLAHLQPLLDAPEFSGVVRVDVGGVTVLEAACGLADRAHQIAMTSGTRIAVASGGKGFTALAVMSLVEQGVLTLDTTARSILGKDLPLIDERVTVEHLLAHRAGIGDYIDEEVHTDINEPVMPVAVHRLLVTEDFVQVLDGFPQVSAPGERFAYNNGGFVVLALLAERASGTLYHDLVYELVIDKAGLTGTAFLRMDELPGDAAIGYLFDDGLRNFLLHLPVRANGDGGIFTTAADLADLWAAFLGCRIVSPESVALMTRSHSDVTGSDRRYGLGFWLHSSNDGVILAGYDAGSSLWSAHRPSIGLTYSVLANTSEGAWTVARGLAPLLNS